jgi:hypothetical protein
MATKIITTLWEQFQNRQKKIPQYGTNSKAIKQKIPLYGNNSKMATIFFHTMGTIPK